MNNVARTGQTSLTLQRLRADRFLPAQENRVEK
jgi:hypothetical protein